jgi:hypothetical protein
MGNTDCGLRSDTIINDDVVENFKAPFGAGQFTTVAKDGGYATDPYVPYISPLVVLDGTSNTLAVSENLIP